MGSSFAIFKMSGNWQFRIVLFIIAMNVELVISADNFEIRGDSPSSPVV